MLEHVHSLQAGRPLLHSTSRRGSPQTLPLLGPGSHRPQAQARGASSSALPQVSWTAGVACSGCVTPVRLGCEQLLQAFWGQPKCTVSDGLASRKGWHTLIV